MIRRPVRTILTLGTWALALVFIAAFVIIVANGGTHATHAGAFVPSVILDPTQVRLAS